MSTAPAFLLAVALTGSSPSATPGLIIPERPYATMPACMTAARAAVWVVDRARAVTTQPAVADDAVFGRYATAVCVRG